MKRIGRRALIRRGAAAAFAVGGYARGARAAKATLRRDPDGILDLLPGFTYRVVQRVGERMDDGFLVPGWPDAMACFQGPDNNWILMRNQELATIHRSISAYPPGSGLSMPPQAVNPARYGGVTRLVMDAASGDLISSNLVLTGTERNCAGGPSPWGWLSCEETSVPGHGYVYLCATDASSVQPGHRITGFGRYRHEAAAVHPTTHVTYLTEDATDSAFYRFLPKSPETPFTGKLQAMTLEGGAEFETSKMRRGERRAIGWVDIPQPDPVDDSVRYQARAAGAAVVSRGEGLWLKDDDLFMCATTGGPGWRGQVFRIRVASAAGAPEWIETVADASGGSDLDMPDNITVSPQGHLYVAEDGLGGNYLRRVDLDGNVVPLAHNAASGGEFAGPCFSPDGRTLFVNLQQDGLTLAIKGPFGHEHVQPAGASASSPPSSEGQSLTWGPAAGAATGLGLLALAIRRRMRAAP